MIYLRSCQDILSLFIDSRIISGPTFAHCSNPSQTNNSVECRIFAHEHTKISSWSVSCGNIFDWSVKRSKGGFSFPSLISMISVTTNSLLKKFSFLIWFDLKNEYQTHCLYLVLNTQEKAISRVHLKSINNKKRVNRIGLEKEQESHASRFTIML